MNLSSSGVDPKLYFQVNTAVTISLASFLLTPPFLLCIVCVLALIFAKMINPKIRFLLINVFTAEALNWIASFIFYLGWASRFVHENDDSCKLFISLYIVSGILKFASTSTYAMNIYIFVKYGETKLKWYVIIPYFVITWVVATIAAGVPPYHQSYGVSSNNGFCTVNPLSAAFISTLTMLTAGASFFLTIELIFCILTFVYMKRNTLKGNTVVKKAVAKVLGYLAVVSVLSFINSVIPHFNPFIFRLTNPISNFATITAIAYLTRVVPNLTAFGTPIVTIILLKPVRDAIKTMSKKVCPCWPNNQVHPAATEEHSATGTTGVSLATTTDEHPALSGDKATTEETTL